MTERAVASLPARGSFPTQAHKFHTTSLLSLSAKFSIYNVLFATFLSPFLLKKTSALGDLANVEAFHLQNSIEGYKYKEHIYIYKSKK
jgi:hypothetical protein